MTSVAWASTDGGIVSPRAWAVWRLMTKSNFVGCSTGRSRLLLALLLLLSNDLSLRELGTRRWKALKRLNYALLGLVAVHAVLFQRLERREPAYVLGFGFVVLVVVLIQAGGWWRRRAGGQRHRLAHRG